MRLCKKVIETPSQVESHRVLGGCAAERVWYRVFERVTHENDLEVDEVRVVLFSLLWRGAA